MRTRTFVFSIAVHAVVIGAAMVTRLFATTELPDPPLTTMFAMVTPQAPEVQPPPAQKMRTATAPPLNHAVVPLEAPEVIAPEPLAPFDVAPVGASTIIGEPGGSAGDLLGAAPPPPVPRVVERPRLVPVGGVVRPPQKVHHVAPSYPPIAQAARVSGLVILEALIAEDGSVRDVKVLKSVPLLDAAAAEAVRQWRFTPTLLNGVPVQVIMSVTVTFALK
jgi:protein TonB